LLKKVKGQEQGEVRNLQNIVRDQTEPLRKKPVMLLNRKE